MDKKTYQHRLVFVIQPISIPVLSSLYEILVESDSEFITEEMIGDAKNKVEKEATKVFNTTSDWIAVAYLSPIAHFFKG